jgi:hypothetical protein
MVNVFYLHLAQFHNTKNFLLLITYFDVPALGSICYMTNNKATNPILAMTLHKVADENTRESARPRMRRYRNGTEWKHRHDA